MPRGWEQIPAEAEAPDRRLNNAPRREEISGQFELGNLDKEFDNSATPESTIRVRHPDDSPTTPESMVSRRQNVPGGWGDQYQDYVPDRYQNNAPRRLNPEVGSQENVIEGHRRRHRANYSDHNHLSTNMTYYSTFWPQSVNQKRRNCSENYRKFDSIEISCHHLQNAIETLLRTHLPMSFRRQ
ncbi:hypothetical protein A1F94_011858 [Pyrenophora tritici-repentis]|nr:hypothetical protein A1F94_011858 [Pyrenophora tritici-repentis]